MVYYFDKVEKAFYVISDYFNYKQSYNHITGKKIKNEQDGLKWLREILSQDVNVIDTSVENNILTFKRDGISTLALQEIPNFKIRIIKDDIEDNKIVKEMELSLNDNIDLDFIKNDLKLDSGKYYIDITLENTINMIAINKEETSFEIV